MEVDLLAASQSLQLPGFGERRVLTPMAVERLAKTPDWPRWRVEALALEMDLIPLHYLRNLAEFSVSGQVRLLQSSVAVVGAGAIADRILELLALNGIGRLRVLTPDGAAASAEAARLAAVAINRNASCSVAAETIGLKGGNPAEALREVDAVACCLDESMEEQLLQFACRMTRSPLIVGGGQAARGQATTVFPGDPGVGAVYRSAHPHLDSGRAGAGVDRKTALVVGTWVAEQVTRILLGSTDLLRGRLRYADLGTGAMEEYPL